MSHRLWISISILAVVPLMPAAAQAPKTEAPRKVAAKNTAPSKKSAVPHTPWGDPDLQGVWNDATSTPLQRDIGVKDVLTDEEAVDFQKSLANDLTRDRRDGGPEVDVNRAYNDHWMDSRRLKILPTAAPDQIRRTANALEPPPPEREKSGSVPLTTA
jgi:hypothetical protein